MAVAFPADPVSATDPKLTPLALKVIVPPGVVSVVLTTVAMRTITWLLATVLKLVSRLILDVEVCGTLFPLFQADIRAVASTDPSPVA
jgi:hypothetical protein